jgi:putative N6-adenine-specific DNA methylase
LENILAREIEALGGQNIQPMRRAVSCTGDKAFVYKANLHARTALRVLIPVYSFKAGNEKELYDKVMAHDWSRYVGLNHTFAIDNVVFSDVFKHSKYVALKVKDAMVDQFRKKTGRRPSVNTMKPDTRFNLHVSGKDFVISLDSSGDSLHKRGYREPGHKAPLNEVLAAGMVLLSGWANELPLVDPMCGSGTLLLESAMMAKNIPPGFHKKNYGFMSWANYDRDLWKSIHKKASRALQDSRAPIIGSDISGKALGMARASARYLGLEDDIHFRKVPFEEYIPRHDQGLLMMNPPYGKRLSPDDLNAFYKMIGDHLKKNFPGFSAWILYNPKSLPRA